MSPSRVMPSVERRKVVLYVVAYDEQAGIYTAGKASTTPQDLTEGMFAGLAQVRKAIPRTSRHLLPEHHV